MATRKIRLNIAAASFPLLSKLTGRSIIIPAPQGVENSVENTSNASAPAQTVRPQPLYMQNFLPIPAGLASVILVEDIVPSQALPQKLMMRTNLYIIRDELDTRVFYLSDPLNNYIYDVNVGYWKRFSVTIPDGKAPPTGKETVTVAYVKGKTYVCIDGYGIYQYSLSDRTFLPITGFSGVNTASIRGVTSAGPYLILYDSTTVYWSNVNNPLDFTPSLTTGAGSTKVLAVRSPINIISPVPDGFIIYTAHNAVYGQTTGDMNTPFIYKEIEGFTGLSSIADLSIANSVTTSQIAWTPTGLVEVNSQATLNSFPELTVFIQGKTVESYDEVNDVINYMTTAFVLNYKFRIIGGRYITISYSLSSEAEFTHALIYDIGLKRWGKIAYRHIDMFEASVPSPYRRVRCNDVALACNSTLSNWDMANAPINARRCNTFTDVQLAYTDPAKILGVITSDGHLHTIVTSTFDDFDKALDMTYPTPYVVFGDYALDRKNITDIVSVEMDHIGANSVVSIETHTAYTSNPVISTPQISPIDNHMYNCRVTGRNHKVRVKGNALLSTVIVEASSTGTR